MAWRLELGWGEEGLRDSKHSDDLWLCLKQILLDSVLALCYFPSAKSFSKQPVTLMIVYDEKFLTEELNCIILPWDFRDTSLVGLDLGQREGALERSLYLWPHWKNLKQTWHCPPKAHLRRQTDQFLQTGLSTCGSRLSCMVARQEVGWERVKDRIDQREWRLRNGLGWTHQLTNWMGRTWGMTWIGIWI